MTENEKIELFDKWYAENYDEWAGGEEGIALREELEQAFKSGIAELEKENAELKAFKQNCIKLTEDNVVMARQRAEMADQLTNAKELLKRFIETSNPIYFEEDRQKVKVEAEQFLKDSNIDNAIQQANRRNGTRLKRKRVFIGEVEND